ncbi:type I-F CRISPR-associated endoribonuclease Cas6/Csy4 [Colwellia sp. RSH04]|uniref:type I-F CRISPR-associated endoribonuclease Cas6/Csy4 n=1 Tax=Colwellia sp. RSH04 TaxID=2305464 RepID=UPI000E59087C|nr:type I-F CRISPR-associated endoribonuclease Cas6/Csy4 [Colwellia sp. RSH04]RHW75044.1 type I-F CRISPR-associated endoribonuclease Cas6/Csy4 [Colwellia sp. RSH04]
MKYYLDITLLPDSEITLGFIWFKVYQQVHIALAENKVGDNQSEIALSFPQYFDKDKVFPLGNKLRIFSPSQALLDKLSINAWLKRFADHTHITSIKAVPESITQYACFSRKQFATNLARLARRRAKRHEETFEQALQHYASFEDKQTKLPYINAKSLTKDEQFKFFIDCELSKQVKHGDFNCYGLSKKSENEKDNQATVPWF